ncbi:hypothetical protein D3C75_1100570 [compost metagenome]
MGTFKAAVRAVQCGAHSNFCALAQRFGVIPQLSDHERNLPIRPLSTSDGEGVGLAQALLLHCQKRKLSGFEIKAFLERFQG